MKSARPSFFQAESPAPSSGSGPASLFDLGRNCCALARADRVALLVDGEQYFSAFAQAAERATRSILIIAWDFNSQARLRMGEESRQGPPNQLGDFLNWLARRRRSLVIRILDWDFPLLYSSDREFPPVYGLGDWKPHRRVQFSFDSTHPLAGSHHQKIVVIDDAMAFVGGFDLTCRRWDTSDHCVDQAGRVAGEEPYPPFHDLMMAVDGEAARVLGAIARERWQAATEHALAPVEGDNDPWPPGLLPDFTAVRVAIARTAPASGERPEVREVEALYLDMIAAARRYIYIENQYFTSDTIGLALAARLAEAEGPEIVVVTRLLSHGWLEEYTMHILRTRLIHHLRAADRNGHFHIYYAHIDGLKDGTCIDIHSKLMIVDDQILRIGSANLCNRSMGMDTECDAAIAAQGDEKLAASIRNFRDRLLGEHLDQPPEAVGREVLRQGSVHGAIDALGGRSRTLKPLAHMPEWSETLVDLAMVADPERPVTLEELVEEFDPEVSPPGTIPAAAKIVILVLTVLVLTALWRHTPLAQFLSPERISGWAREFADRPWAPLVILAAYTPACVVMFPRLLITLGAVVAFGPYRGFAYAMSGILVAAFLSYFVGSRLPRGAVRRFVGERLNAVMEALSHRGLLAMTALRLVPVAPFVVIGLAAGGVHIRLRHFMLGTLFGMLPGTLATTVFGGQLENALTDPSSISYGFLAGVLAIFVVASLVLRKWLKTQRLVVAGPGKRHDDTADHPR